MLPKVKKVELGKILVDDKMYGEMDLLLHLKGHEEIDKTHNIGLMDYEIMMLRDPEVLIFGLGFNSEAKLNRDVLAAARRDKVEVMAMTSQDAIKKFFDLARKGMNVVARIHTTE